MPAQSKYGTKDCLECNKEIILKINRDKKRKKFCSRDCLKKAKVLLNCRICNKSFEKSQLQYNRGLKDNKKEFSCSPKCAATKKSLKGLTHKALELYKSGKTIKQISEIIEKPTGTIGSWLNKQKFRKYTGNGKSYASVKNKLIKRHDYKCCVICGFDRIIEIAHIIPASKGGDLTYQNTLPLCPNHHHLFDNNKLIDIEIDFINKEKAKRYGSSS